MSGVKAVNYLLSIHVDVLAIVAAARVISGTAPQGIALPALVVQEVSSVERLTVSMGEAKKHMTERVQVTIHATTYDQQKQLLAAVRKACQNRCADTDGVDVLSVKPGGTGPDGFDPPTLDYQQTTDFLVEWRRAAA
jgi:hypothetical protein